MKKSIIFAIALAASSIVSANEINLTKGEFNSALKTSKLWGKCEMASDYSSLSSQVGGQTELFFVAMFTKEAQKVGLDLSEWLEAYSSAKFVYTSNVMKAN